MSYSPWGLKESDTTEQLTHTHMYLRSSTSQLHCQLQTCPTLLAQVLRPQVGLHFCLSLTYTQRTALPLGPAFNIDAESDHLLLPSRVQPPFPLPWIITM